MQDRRLHTHGGTKKNMEIDCSVNVNPLGMPQGCTDILRDGLYMAGRYPDCDAYELTDELSEICGKNPVIPGNGSCELIYAVCHYVGHKFPGFCGLTIAPSFTEYGYAIKAGGGKHRVFKTDGSKDHMLSEDIERFIETIRGMEDLKLVFICNPNNPTGEYVRRDHIERIADILASLGAILVVDECFLRFGGRYEERSMTGVLSGHPNVIVLDAFTKFYAMPGLRLGYAVSADGEMLNGIRECIQPWNVSSIAYKTGLAALKDSEYSLNTEITVKKNREYIIDVLKSISLRVIGNPEADYVFFEGPSNLREALNEEGIDIRECSDMMECFGTNRHYYRMAVLCDEDNRRVADAIRKILWQSH